MLFSNIRKFIQVARSEGLMPAGKIAFRKLARHKAIPAAIRGKISILEHYQGILGHELGLGLKITSKNVPEGSMTWVIPDFSSSSGGHINILRMMRLLKVRGFPNQHVVIAAPHRWTSAAQAQLALNEAFGDHGITVSLGVESIEPCLYLVATGWQTAYWVSKYRDALHKIYFVQDFEPMFYASGSEYILAENTYRLGLTAITAGSWLSDKLSSEYGMTAFPFSFSYDREVYRPYPKREHAARNIFFYARPVTPRRCFEIGLLALKELCDRRPDVAVIFAGWDVSDYDIPFKHLNAGSVSLRELPDLYSQCDAALILSSTNLSLLPMEVAACKCPLVLGRGANGEWIFDDDEAAYSDMDPKSIADAIEEVLDNPGKTKARVEAAYRKTQNSDWGVEADKVAAFIKQLGD